MRVAHVLDVRAMGKTGSNVHDFLEDRVQPFLHIVVREPHDSIALPLEPQGAGCVVALGFIMCISVDLHHKPAKR